VAGPGAAGPQAPLVPDFVLRRPAGRIGGVVPVTRLVVVLAATAVAFGVRGWTGPIAVLAAGLLAAAAARLGRRIVAPLLATAPIVVSVLVLDGLLWPGGVHDVAVGPVGLSGDGLAAGAQAALRVLAFALAVAILAMTTPVDDLLDDLEAHGAGRRAVFVVGSAIRTVPRLLERGRDIADAQRARGLDLDGPPWRRARGVVPLAGPLVVGVLAEADDRSIALESRAFSRPGRRASLRPFADSTRQRVIRWGLAVAAAALVAASVTGRWPLP
jgi:energy-coupling factor transport system permease protein